MTPEEAKPKTICIMSEMTFADGMFQGPIREGFTAKETAEIAKAYAQACLVCEDTCYLGCNHLSNCRDYWRINIKEWSK